DDDDDDAGGCDSGQSGEFVCDDGCDEDDDGLTDCDDVEDCGADPACDDGTGDDDDSGAGGDDDDSDLPACCDDGSCADNAATCGSDEDNPCEFWPPPWGTGDLAGDGPDHCADYSASDCTSCYDEVDLDNDGGADCNDPEALAAADAWADGDYFFNAPNCFLIRICDGDPATDCSIP
ncbi:MAG TPA: hypothetical protein DIU15_02710, partial [Deltaproteobacteria bacterium]|nr:hypothetical protein [Deltaproteobacteria bacterium]